LIAKALLGSNIGLSFVAEVVLDVMTPKTWFASVLLLTIAMLTTTLGNLYLFCYWIDIASYKHGF